MARSDQNSPGFLTPTPRYLPANRWPGELQITRHLEECEVVTVRGLRLA